MNTHSSCADARLELLAAHGIRAGADVQTAKSNPGLCDDRRGIVYFVESRAVGKDNAGCDR